MAARCQGTPNTYYLLKKTCPDLDLAIKANVARGHLGRAPVQPRARRAEQLPWSDPCPSQSRLRGQQSGSW